MRTPGLVLALLLGGAASAQDRENKRGAGEELLPGLVGEYYHLGRPLEDFPARDALQRPRFKRVDPKIDYPRTDPPFAGTKLKDRFFVRWTGLVRIPRDGKYLFFTSSEGGSRLFVDGRLLVQNVGRREMKEEKGEVELRAGDHEIRIDYVHDAGRTGLVVSWEGPQIRKGAVAESALFHRRSAHPSEEERKGIDLPVQEEARKGEKSVGEGDRKAGEAGRPERNFHVNERIVGKDEKQPDVGGGVLSVFDDGPVTLINIRTPAGETPIYVPKGASVTYVGIEKEAQKPTVGFFIYVWLKPGSSDTAASVRFGR